MRGASPSAGILRASAALCALAVGCAHQSARGDAASGWVELTTEHFVVQTDVPADDARQLAQDLEDVRAAILAGSWHGNRLRADKIRVVEFADEAEMREVFPQRFAGLFLDEALFGEALMVMSAEQSPERQPVLKHELAHQIQASFLVRSKPWITEGIAGYIATLRYDHANEQFVFGEPDVDMLAYLNERPESDLPRVLAATPEEFARLGPEDTYAFEAASWFVVYYLANERAADLEDYLRRLAHAEDPDAAFRASFPGLSPDVLWQEVSAFERTTASRQIGIGQRVATYTALKLKVPKWAGPVESRRLDKAEVAALRGELLLYSFDSGDRAQRIERARAAVEEALRLDPASPVALAVRVSTGRGLTEGDIEQMRAATKARPDDPRAWRLLGRSLPDADFQERKAALERAVALAPNDVATLDALAWDHLRGGRGIEAMRAATRAVVLSPGRATALDALAAALAMTNRCDEATKTAQRAVEMMSEHASKRARTGAAGRLKAFRAGCRDIPLD